MHGCGTMEKQFPGSPYDLYCLNTAATLSILFFFLLYIKISYPHKTLISHKLLFSDQKTEYGEFVAPGDWLYKAQIE